MYPYWTPAKGWSRGILLLLAAWRLTTRDVVARSRSSDGAFVRVNGIGNGFVVDGEPFPVVGFNLWEVVDAASCVDEANCAMPDGSPLRGRPYVDAAFDQARSSGFTTVRVFAHGVTPDYASMDSTVRLAAPVVNCCLARFLADCLTH